MIQEGIYLERSSPPPAAWRVLFLDVAPGTAASDAAAAIGDVMAMLAALQQGTMIDLSDVRPGEAPATIPVGTFDVLLGYGASFFDPARHDPPLTAATRPSGLVGLRPSPGPAFPHMEWETSGRQGHSGEADLVLQFTGVNEQAVDRAAVEVAKLIGDRRLPLTTAGTYDGFLRDDGRSWIGFHDGVSNIEPSQRLAAVECHGDPDWNSGGTYLAFLRLQVALGPWRRLDRATQETIVGRDKLSGSPLMAVERDGDGALHPRPLAAAAPPPDTGPVPGPGSDADWQQRDAHFNPPETGDRLVEASHIHRVNQNRAAGGTRAGHRIFRQGYEYLEDITPDGPRLGLNFVSFQNDLEQLQQILSLDGWLGDVNFGGPTDPETGDPQPLTLMSVRAGGFYAVPPREDPFPGAGLFGLDG